MMGCKKVCNCSKDLKSFSSFWDHKNRVFICRKCNCIVDLSLGPIGKSGGIGAIGESPVMENLDVFIVEDLGPKGNKGPSGVLGMF